MNVIRIPYISVKKYNDMRKYFATAALLACCILVSAQEADSSIVSGSRASALTSKSGTLIRMECLTSESLSSMSEHLEIEACVVTDVMSGRAERAVLFSSGKSGAYPTYRSAVDEDEIQALLEALGRIIKEAAERQPSPYVRLSFRSRDGLSIGTEWNLTDARRGVGARYVFVRHTRYAGKPAVTFADTKRLSQIRDAVVKASEALSAAK